MPSIFLPVARKKQLHSPLGDRQTSESEVPPNIKSNPAILASRPLLEASLSRQKSVSTTSRKRTYSISSLSSPTSPVLSSPLSELFTSSPDEEFSLDEKGESSESENDEELDLPLSSRIQQNHPELFEGRNNFDNGLDNIYDYTQGSCYIL